LGRLDQKSRADRPTAPPPHRSTAAPPHGSTAAPPHRGTAAQPHRGTVKIKRRDKFDPALQLVIDQLEDFEYNRRKGAIVLPDGDTLDVGNLEKVFWPELKLTKGDLLRYYVRISPY